MTQASKPQTDVLASVIVPCYNSAEHITALLEGLCAQTLTGHWELILVNRGSQDATAQIVQGFANRLPLRLIDEPDNHGVSFSRNDGASYAESENLIFIDSDDIPNRTYLQAMLVALGHSNFVCASMDYAALNPDWIVQAFAREIEGGIHNPVAPYANGGNIGIKKALFNQLGGFDTSLPAFEDLDFSWRVFKLGHQMILVKDAVLAYRVNPDLRALYRKCYRDSRPNARVLQKNFPGYVPPWMCLLGLAARAMLLTFSMFTLFSYGRLARWVLACAYWRGDFEGCIRERYLHLLPKGQSPREARAKQI